LRLFSFGGYGFALAALALEVFGAYDSYPNQKCFLAKIFVSQSLFLKRKILFEKDAKFVFKKDAKFD